MIVLEKKVLVDLVNQHAIVHKTKLLSVISTIAHIDNGFAKHALNALDSFVLHVPIININDTYKFNQNIQLATDLQNEYDSYGDYCFEILNNAYIATNELLALNAELYNALMQATNTESKLTVSTGFIACNFMQNKFSWTLSNFSTLRGLSINFDINVQRANLGTTFMHETMQQNTEIGAFYDSIACLKTICHTDRCNRLLTEWYEKIVPLTNAKKQALYVFNLVWQIYALDNIQIECSKDVNGVLCKLMTDKMTVNEHLVWKSFKRSIAHQNAPESIIMLDYFNNLNIQCLP